MEGTSSDIRERGVRGTGRAFGETRASRGRDGDGERLALSLSRIALGLGVFGVGLGLAQLLAPRRLNRLAGVARRPSSRTRALTRALGVRELVSGLGLLGRRRPGPWLWARVAGDAMDLALLGAASRRRDVKLARLAGTLAGVVGVTALDIYAATKSRGRERGEVGPVRRTITIAATPERAYSAWRELKNLPTFMNRVASVEELDARRSRWRVAGPLGRTLQWEAEIIEDRPNECLRWRSVRGAGADVVHDGAVTFRPAPGGRGTEVGIELSYVPPAGELGRAAAGLSNQALGVELERDLRRFKQLLELGEVVHSDASIHRGLHAAQPTRS
jgi:uncharacterized membrane protein